MACSACRIRGNCSGLAAEILHFLRSRHDQPYTSCPVPFATHPPGHRPEVGLVGDCGARVLAMPTCPHVTRELTQAGPPDLYGLKTGWPVQPQRRHSEGSSTTKASPVQSWVPLTARIHLSQQCRASATTAVLPTTWPRPPPPVTLTHSRARGNITRA